MEPGLHVAVLGSRECLGLLQVALKCHSDAIVVAGGQEIEQQPASDRHAEPGFCAGGGLVRSRADQCVRDRGEPWLDNCLKKALGARASEQCVSVQLEEQPFGRP